MAEFEAVPDGSFLLIENHCPICAAAKTCQGFCRSELELFRAAFGAGISVMRQEHLLSDGRRCVYRVTSGAGPIIFVMLTGGLTGIGFGLSYAFITQGILGALPGEERAIGGAGIATAWLTGAVAGSAMAAAVANLAGFADGFTVPAAQTAGIRVFLAALPVAALACLSAWQRPRAVRIIDPL